EHAADADEQLGPAYSGLLHRRAQPQYGRRHEKLVPRLGTQAEAALGEQETQLAGGVELGMDHERDRAWHARGQRERLGVRELVDDVVRIARVAHADLPSQPR